MAIGDAVAVYMGTGTVTRQPSSGVEEQITAIIKAGGTDQIQMYDGTTTMPILSSAVETDEAHGTSSSTRQQMFNTAFLITNAVYLRKTGTTDIVYIGGVQTNV